VLTPFFERRTRETVILYYRLCNGKEEYLFLDTNPPADPATP
jgi:hypothetical protein